MNPSVRKYLIDCARRGKPAYYSEVNRECGLGFDLGNNGDNHKFSEILGNASIYESQYDRPLISSMATYSPNSPGYAQDIHGDGFYRICESLGKGTLKKLKMDGFGIQEMNRCIEFWQDEGNYSQFYDLSEQVYPPFFTADEIIFFHRWADEVYNKNNPEHIAAKNYLLDATWAKTKYWSEEVTKRVAGLEVFNRRTWGQPGWDEGRQVSRFKPYTWARIYRKNDLKKDIFFTVGVEAQQQVLLYKLDYYFERDGNLSVTQKEMLKNARPEHVRWNTIPLEAISTYDWPRLIKITVDFITANLPLYDRLIAAVWQGENPDGVFSNCLFERPKPGGGIAELPKQNFSFQGKDIDWRMKQEEQQLLGESGEQLVLLWEKEKLKSHPDLAKKVEKVKDGKGFDIISFTESGEEVYIEVKTTTGDSKVPFEISINEIAFAQQNPGKHRLYRLYNYQENNNTAEFFVLTNIAEETVMQPLTYRAYLKKQ